VRKPGVDPGRQNFLKNACEEGEGLRSLHRSDSGSRRRRGGCVPAFKNPWKLPLSKGDAILKHSSFRESMHSFRSVCFDYDPIASLG
jgi:hypothetical protein